MRLMGEGVRVAVVRRSAVLLLGPILALMPRPNAAPMVKLACGAAPKAVLACSAVTRRSGP